MRFRTACGAVTHLEMHVTHICVVLSMHDYSGRCRGMKKRFGRAGLLAAFLVLAVSTTALADTSNDKAKGDEAPVAPIALALPLVAAAGIGVRTLVKRGPKAG